jgi:hypothetical protein
MIKMAGVSQLTHGIHANPDPAGHLFARHGEYSGETYGFQK